MWTHASIAQYWHLPFVHVLDNTSTNACYAEVLLDTYVHVQFGQALIYTVMAHKDQMLEILCWLRTMPGSERKPKPMAWRQIGLALVLICAASMFGQAHGETYEESKMYSYDKYTEGPRLTGHVQNWATLIQNYILQVNKNVYQSWSLPTCTCMPCHVSYILVQWNLIIKGADTCITKPVYNKLILLVTALFILGVVFFPLIHV